MIDKLVVEDIEFPGGKRARLIRTGPEAEAHPVLTALGIPRARPLIVVNGGTAQMEGELERRVATILHEAVAVYAIEHRCTLVTGGTDAGVFALLGHGLGLEDGSFVCIGIVPSDLVTWPQRGSDGTEPNGDERVPLEANHSHFVVVEGRQWGDETPIMLELARYLGAESPSVAVLAGGGKGAEEEILGHVRQGRPVIVLHGSGRWADVVAAAVLRHEEPRDTTIAEVVRGEVAVVDVDHGPHELLSVLHEYLGPSG